MWAFFMVFGHSWAVFHLITCICLFSVFCSFVGCLLILLHIFVSFQVLGHCWGFFSSYYIYLCISRVLGHCWAFYSSYYIYLCIFRVLGHCWAFYSSCYIYLCIFRVLGHCWAFYSSYYMYLCISRLLGHCWSLICCHTDRIVCALQRKNIEVS